MLNQNKAEKAKSKAGKKGGKLQIGNAVKIGGKGGKVQRYTFL